jgi:DNA-binding IclR family transcriptional regulator
MAPVEAGDAASSRSVVHRTVLVLEAFTAQPRWGVRELASRLGIAKSGLHRTLQEMSVEGLLRSDEDGSYEVGAQLLRLASELLRTTDISRYAQEHLARATRLTGETTLLAAYDPQRQQIIAIDSVESPKPVQFRGALGDWTDLHLSASGLGILAFLPPEDLARYFKEERKDPSGKSVTARSIEPTLKKIRKAGWSYTHSARIAGTSGVCSPIMNGQGRIVGGVVIVWPDRTETVDPTFFGKTCLDTASDISAELGGSREQHGAAER